MLVISIPTPFHPLPWGLFVCLFLACWIALQIIKLTFHLKSLQLGSQPDFAVLVRKTFGKSLTLNFEADMAICIEGVCWSETSGFHELADADKGTGRHFCLS